MIARSDTLYTGTCVRCGEELRAVLAVEAGRAIIPEPAVVVSHSCDLPTITVELMYRGSRLDHGSA